MTLALDLDGTLVTCRERQSTLMGACLRACGKALDSSRYWTDKREGCNNLAALARQGFEPLLAREADRLWRLAIEDPAWLALDRVQVAPARIETALLRLRPRYGRVLLVTARRQARLVPMQLRALGLASLFDAVLVCDPARARDAKREIFAANDVAAYVGDTEADASAARDAKVEIRLVASGQRSEAFLANATGLVAATDVLSALECLP